MLKSAKLSPPKKIWWRKLPKPFRQLVKKTLFILVLLLIWYGIFLLKLWPSWIFPSPLKVGETLWTQLMNGLIFNAVLVSLRRLAIGFGLSVLVGSILGFLIARYKHVSDTLGFFILGLQTLPSICWLPLALLWFGLNEQAILFVVVMGAVLSVTISVEGAVKSIPPLIVRAGKVLGADGWTLYRRVIFPAILPSFVVGLKQGWAFAWRSLMAGEMLFITAGLGQLLMAGREFNNMSQVLAVMIVIVTIGMIFDKVVFGSIEQQLHHKWGTQHT